MTAELVIMQGDQYAIPVGITDKNNAPVPPDAIAEVEMVVGTLRKTLTAGEITYSEEQEAYLFPVTQEESFGLRAQPVPVQIRVKTTSGDVTGENLGRVIITESRSKEVL